MKRIYLLFFLSMMIGIGAQSYDRQASVETLKNQLKAKQAQRTKDLERLEKLPLKKSVKKDPLKKITTTQDSLVDSSEHYFKGFDMNGVPQFYNTHNYGAARATGVTMLRDNQLKAYRGKGMIIGEWDGGHAQNFHPDFGDRVSYSDAAGVSVHATHVGGTITGGGDISRSANLESAEGMAPEASLHTYYWDNDELEMIHEVEKGLVISNHSYGFTIGVVEAGYDHPVFYGHDEDADDYHYGYYSTYDSIKDAIVYNFPSYLPVFSAGNDGVKPGLAEGESHYVWINGIATLSTKKRNGSCASGYDCLPYGNIGKNILTVGAVNKTIYDAKNDSYTIAAFSSKGPSDDGRVKPDITSPGVNIISTAPVSPTLQVNPTLYYTSMSGTSMASPVVTGGIALIQESAKEHLQKPLLAATVKALVTHTAHDAGNVGPDYIFGWGVFDAFNSVQTIEKRNSTSMLEEASLNNSEKKRYTITAVGGEPLKITISWTDVPGKPNLNPTLNAFDVSLVNDLDIRIYDAQNQVYLPWILDRNQPEKPATKGDNIVDNVEQVLIENPIAGGQYIVEISHKGTLTNPSHNFSLIATGLNDTPLMDLSFDKVEKRDELKSYETPGVYVSLKGMTAFANTKINYTLKQHDVVVFQGEQTINYDPAQGDAFFMPLSSDAFFPLTKIKYTLDFSLVHSDDQELRNNTTSYDYYYYVERLDKPKNIYLQAFNSFDAWLLKRKILPNNTVNIGWKSIHATGGIFSNNTLRSDGIGLYITDDQNQLKTNPFYLAKDEIYNVSLWLNETEILTSKLTFKVMDSFTHAVLAAGDILKRSETKTSNEDATIEFTHYQNTFNINTTGYVYLLIENPENNRVSIDDFSMAIANGNAIGAYYTYNYPNTPSDKVLSPYDLRRLEASGTFSPMGWNEFRAHAYDMNMLPVDLSTDDYQILWDFKGSDHTYENNTNTSSEVPRLRFLETNKMVEVALSINNSLTQGFITTINPMFVQSFTISQEHLLSWNTFSLISNTSYPKGLKIHAFTNEGNSFSIPPNFFVSNIVTANSVSRNEMFDLSYTVTPKENIVSLPPQGPSKPYYILDRFTEPGDYQVSMHIKDVDTKGAYMNHEIPVATVQVHNSFPAIAELSLETSPEQYNLHWTNPTLYHSDVMSFEDPAYDTRFPALDTYTKTAQFKGDAKLGWRAHNIAPIIALHGRTSMVSESLDEDSMEHKDIDNWFFTTQAYPSALQYLSFYASQSADYNYERYQVYLLDASLVSDLNTLSADDFTSKGVLVKTEQVEGLDEVLANSENPTVLKALDLKQFGLMNKDVLVAFRHHTLAADKGSFLSIDLLKFHNKIREVGKPLESDESYLYGLTGESLILSNGGLLFETSGKSDIGWFSLNARTYPVKGYEIAEIDKKGNRTLIATIDKHIIDSFSLDKDLVSKEARKLSVTLLFDNSVQVDDFKKLDRRSNFPSNQSELDQYVPTELMVEINLAAPLAPNEDTATLYRHNDDITNLYLRLRSTYLGTVNYQIYDVAGHSLMANTFEKDEPAYDQPIAIDGLHDGMYFIKIIAGNSVHYKKFVK